MDIMKKGREKSLHSHDVNYNENGTVCYKRLTTNILGVVIPDTYSGGFLDDVYKDMVDNAMERVKEIGLEKLQELLDPYNVGNIEIKSTQYYNFETDSFEFDISMTLRERAELLALAKQDGFFDWARERFGSYDGFISFMPVTEEEFKEAINGKHIDDYKENRAIQMCIKKKLEDEYDLCREDNDFIESVFEYLDANGYIEYEDDEDVA